MGLVERSTLEEFADTAEAIADDHHQVAREAVQMQRLRDRGWSWSQILDAREELRPVELLRRGARRTAGLTSRMSSLLAHALAQEGESRRQIGRRLGVTHQRVTAILREHRMNAS